MKCVVVYKTKYGSTRTYAEWIAEALDCDIKNAKETDINELLQYDTIIYGGGLYSQVINGVSLITKNFPILKGKKIVVYTTGIAPLDCRDYYDKMVIEKNFTKEMTEKIKVFNFIGKMITDELTFVHKTALKTLKKIMQGKENPTDMEKMLIDLCDANGDFTDKAAIKGLVEYVKEKEGLVWQ